MAAGAFGPPARAIVLGSAAGGGVPQWNCACPVCALARAGDVRVRPRTQASLAVTGDGASWTLIDASPDLPEQLRQTSALAPGGLRDSPIGAVVLTGAEIDQIGGLLSLRERHRFRLVALAPVLAILDENPVFSALARDLVERVTVAPGIAVATTPGLRVRLVPVPGKAPLYLEGQPAAAGAPHAQTAMAVVETGRRRLVYAPACAGLTTGLAMLMAEADVVLFDGTVFTDDELIRREVGLKTGRRMGHLPMTGEDGSLVRLAGLCGRRLYTHLNNTNPVLIEASPERRHVEAAGVEIAFDGMEVAL